MKTSDECEDQLARLSWAQDVPAPLDADGKPVPLCTEKLYTGGGEEFSVDGITYLLDERGWAARGASKHSKRICAHDLRFLHLAPPDSWEKLLEDLKRAPEDTYSQFQAPCYYAADGPLVDCDGCRFGDSEKPCVGMAFHDIADRIRKLRGEAQ